MNASGGVLPTLIDEQQLIESKNEDWVSKSSTVVQIAQIPSLPTLHEEEDVGRDGIWAICTTVLLLDTQSSFSDSISCCSSIKVGKTPPEAFM